MEHIVSQFKTIGQFKQAIVVKTGHINDSYIIQTHGDHPGYFLQRINHAIFKDVEGLMKNMEVVTRHLAKKGEGSQKHQRDKVLEIIPTHEGYSFFRDLQGNYWRLLAYIPNTHCYDIVDNPAIALEGGMAFGRFMSALADLPADKLTETIPDFHNLEKRLATYQATLEKNPVNRKSGIPGELQFIRERTESMLQIPLLLKTGKLPWRITHNDTKFNNILFDDSNHAMCVVDLDTVMPGSVLFDFGDAIRSGTNTASEDEPDLNKVDINLSVFEAYATGFIHETRNSLTEVELKNLAFSARFMTFIIGLRFLTDYLDGDRYYQTKHPGHNLERARVQFKLIEAMEAKSSQMESIILNAANHESDPA
jgi:Ser/Thr protein kinase RdoA (MazF antagonist)